MNAGLLHGKFADRVMSRDATTVGAALTGSRNFHRMKDYHQCVVWVRS